MVIFLRRKDRLNRGLLTAEQSNDRLARHTRDIINSILLLQYKYDLLHQYYPIYYIVKFSQAFYVWCHVKSVLIPLTQYCYFASKKRSNYRRLLTTEQSNERLAWHTRDIIYTVLGLLYKHNHLKGIRVKHLTHMVLLA